MFSVRNISKYGSSAELWYLSSPTSKRPFRLLSSQFLENNKASIRVYEECLCMQSNPATFSRAYFFVALGSHFQGYFQARILCCSLGSNFLNTQQSAQTIIRMYFPRAHIHINTQQSDMLYSAVRYVCQVLLPSVTKKNMTTTCIN